MLDQHRKDLQNGVSAHRAGRLDLAQQSYAQLYAIYPDNFDVVHLLGLTHFQMGDVQRGAALIGEALRINPNSAAAHNNLGNVLKAGGRLAEARDQFDRALALKPDYPEALTNRGAVGTALGEPAEALGFLDRALRLVPAYPDAHVNRGLALRQLGRPEEALRAFDAALVANPRSLEALANKGNLLVEQDRAAEAIPLLDSAVRLRPQHPDGHLNLANALLAAGRAGDALASYDKAIALKPDHAEAHANRGRALKNLDRLPEALESYDRAIALRPGDAETLGHRANLLRAMERCEEALADHDRAIALTPDSPAAHNDRGNTLKDMRRFAEALAAYDRALALRPASEGPEAAIAEGNRGTALRGLGRLDEALAAYDAAIARDPLRMDFHRARAALLVEMDRMDEALAGYDAAVALAPDDAALLYEKAHALLARGDFQNGFDLYRWRLQTKDYSGAPVHAEAAWDGEPFTGSLLLWTEQGIGDEVFFASMLSLMPGGISVNLAADRRLHAIFARSLPGIRLIDRAEQGSALRGDIARQASVSDLGALLKLDAEKIARRRYPFLVADEARRRAIRAGMGFAGEGPVCGIAWKSTNMKIANEKSVRLTDYAPLFSLPGLSFVNLQYGDVAADIAEARAVLGTEVHQAEGIDVFNDIDGLLALIAACDIVFTSCNVTAHLAGAMGKKAAVLVPIGKGRIWYWQGEPASLWYPSLRLFVQDRTTDWDKPIRRAVEWVRENT